MPLSVLAPNATFTVRPRDRRSSRFGGESRRPRGVMMSLHVIPDPVVCSSQPPEAPMSDEPDPVTLEKTGGTLIARPRVKLMDDESLQLLARLIDEASGDPTGEAAGGAAPVPLVVIDLSRVAI